MKPALSITSLEFSTLLSETVIAFSQEITCAYWEHDPEHYEVHVTYHGGEISFLESSFSGTRELPNSTIASSLWAQTAVIRRAPTLEAFAEFMSSHLEGGTKLKPSDVREKYTIWYKTAEQCRAVIGDNWGNNQLLLEVLNS